MSGIAGILRFDGKSQEGDEIRLLTAAMRRRGPDAQHHWVEGTIALGHSMLRTTPQSLNEVQPLVDERAGCAIVFSGRLDNREELHAALKPPVACKTATDAELVLSAYLRWKEACPRRLLGDFAFAIWDRVKQKLYCTRDSVGGEALYVVQNDSFFAFASEAEALVHLPGVSARPNETFISCILVPEFQNYRNDRFWLRDVGMFKPGEWREISITGAVASRRYWDFENEEPHRFASDDECVEHFLEVFGEAVACRTRSADDIAVMMSGGLDSAGIAAMLHRQRLGEQGKRVHSYSAISDRPEECIESRAILEMAQTMDLVPHYVKVPSFAGMLNQQDLVDTAIRFAHPVNNSILLPALMCLAASRDGHRVMLHGVCGDPCMDTPRYYPSELIRRGKLALAWHESRMASRNNLFLQGRPAANIFLRSVASRLAPPSLSSMWRRQRYNSRPSPLRHSLASHELIDKLGLQEKLDDEFALKNRAIRDGGSGRQLWSRLGMIDSGLTGYTRVASPFGVELRDPWADRRVLEFFMRLPIEYQVREGWAKFMVRQAFSNELGTETRWRRDKMHLGGHFIRRFLLERKELLDATMTEDLELIEPYIDLQALDSVYQRYLKDKSGDSVDTIFDIFTLILWLQRINSV